MITELALLLVTVGFELATLVLLSALMAVPVWLLWNGIVPGAFHAPALTFLQVWGLLWLLSLLRPHVRTKETK